MYNEHQGCRNRDTKKVQCENCESFVLSYSKELTSKEIIEGNVVTTIDYSSKGLCYFNPQKYEVRYDHWCGQFIKKS